MTRQSTRLPSTKPQFVRDLVRMIFEKGSDRNFQFDLYLLVGQVLGFVHPNINPSETRRVSVCRFRLIDNGD